MIESKHTRPEALLYYAVSLPAVVLVFLFAAEIAERSPVFITPLAILGNEILQLAFILPWLGTVVCLYALYSFRSGLLVITLTASFFVLTTVSGQVDHIVASGVVAATFLSLMGFNFARAARVLGTRSLQLSSAGPYWTRLTSLGFDLGLPFAVAFGLVALVAYLVGVLKAGVVSLPDPLSTLASSYLKSHVYLVFTIITLAGLTVWATRQILEPVIMWFTLTASDARKESWYQLETAVGKIRSQAGRRPTSGKGTLAFSVFLLFTVIVYLLMDFGPNRVANSLFSLVGLGQLEPNQPGLFDETIAKNLVRQIDYWKTWLEDVARLIIKILWG